MCVCGGGGGMRAFHFPSSRFLHQRGGWESECVCVWGVGWGVRAFHFPSSRFHHQTRERELQCCRSYGRFVGPVSESVAADPALHKFWLPLCILCTVGVVNSLDFCPASVKSLGCFYFRCVLSSQWKAVIVNLRILHCQI